LVHSSTLVTAGVYILIRFYYNIIYSGLSIGLLLISILTIFIAGVSSLQEFDIKRLVAFSTLGQLGFIIVILSLGGLYISFFHLIIHALFKALLFICTGLIIHRSLGNQDMRKIGSLILNPIIIICLNISIYSLIGLPFSSGFFSKDLLLEIMYCSYGGIGLGIFIFLIALLTVSYSSRMIFYINYIRG